MTVLAVLAILVPAALGVGAALWLRARLKALSFTAWIGWTLVGTGLPVLAGQLAALALAANIESALEACDAAGGEACVSDPLPVILALTAGLAGGLGWAAGAVSTRLAPGRPRD